MKKKTIVIAGIVVLFILLLWAGLYLFKKVSFFSLLYLLLGLGITAALIYGAKIFLAWRSEQKSNVSHREVNVLQEKMLHAMEKLNASKDLSALPWYMLIGPSGSGKSTLLRHSELHFPYGTPAQDTKNCDWWFADEAVILDVTGSYIFDESNNAQWVGFLRELRRSCVLNGVILAFSLQDILSSDKKNLTQQINEIRQKLDELNRELGIMIPVQIVMTQCDVLEGFSYFFKDLSQESREQPWGINLHNNAGKTSLSALVDKLSDWRLHKLSLHPQLAHKHEILKFPCEFEKALEKVSIFLSEITKQNHYQEHPNFQGLYFTSALQDTMPRRSYFIKDLFQKIIFKKQPIFKNAMQRKLHLGMVCASTMMVLMLTVITWRALESGYHLQTDLYVKEEPVLKPLQPKAADQATQFMRFYEHYSYLKALDAKNDWRFRLGINSLNTELDNNEKLFVAYFSEKGLPLIQQALRESLQKEIQSWPKLNAEQRAKNYSVFYDHLKVYLMLGSPQKLDPEFSAKTLSKLSLAQQGFIQEPVLLSYFTLVKEKASDTASVELDNKLIQLARDILLSSPDPKIMYQHLISRGQDELGTASIQDLFNGKDQGMLISGFSLPKMYTKSAFQKTVLPMIEDIAANAGTGDWVLQEGAKPKRDKKTQQKWINELRALYFRDYAKHWLQWTASLQIKPFHSLDDAVTKLERLKDEKGPLSAAFQVLDQNLSLDVPELKQTYQGIRQVISTAPGKSASETLSAYLSQLAIVQSDLAILSASSDPLRDADTYARKIFADNAQASLSAPLKALNGLDSLSTQSKQALNALLRSPIEQSWRSILSAALLHIQQQWDAEVLEVYNQSLRGKFPFAKTHIEVALDDVTHFFNPRNGQLIRFQDQVLKPYLKQNKGSWQEQEWLGQKIGFSKAFLNSLIQGQQIGHALFKARSAEPEFSFYIQPIPLPGIEELIFDTNGQQYRYRNEPEEWRRFTWPGDASQIGARLYVSANQHKTAAEIEHHGLWGLFHLLADAKFVKQGGSQYMTEWQLHDKNGQILPVKIRMKADKQNNMLDPRLLMQFRLPEKITQAQS